MPTPMTSEKFDAWLPSYLAWRTDAAKILGQRLPSEIVKLLWEQAELEKLRFEAEGFRADAVAHYYAAKLKAMDSLWTEVAKTALNDIAKAQCYKMLWAKESTDGVAEAVVSRSFKVSAELKRQGAA